MENDNEIDISIIIPVYNCEKYLKRCIDSILSQKDIKLEIILVNDGSTDNSKGICEMYSNKYENIKTINVNNNGVSAARNIGLKSVRGKYISFCDADDYIEEGFIKETQKIIEENDKIELINFGFYVEVESKKKVESTIINIPEKLYNSYDEIKMDLIYLWDKHMLYNIWNKIYLRSIIVNNKITFPNINFGEDMEFNKKYMCNISKFYNSDKCFYHYVKERKNSITNIYNVKLFGIRISEFNEFNRYFQAEKFKFEEYIEFSSRRFLERAIGCIENICGSKISNKEKKSEIEKIIKSDIVKETVKYAKLNSKKMEIMVKILKTKSIFLIYIMMSIISKIRNVKPELFNKLKNRR